MIKKSFTILSISAAFFLQAQDTSVLRNALELYSGPTSLGSAKYNAMAGSSGALGGDASSIATNPAGVGVAIASDLSATLTIDRTENATSLHENSLNYKLNSTDLGHVGGIAVFSTQDRSAWKFINLGVSFTRQSAEDYSQAPGNALVTFDLSDGDQLSYNGHAFNRLGDLSKMSLAVGANYEHRIYVGGAINLHGASLSQWDTAAMKYKSDGETEVFSKQYTPYFEDASGFSASIGVIGKVSPELRLGAALETPTWWQMERTYQYFGLDSSEDGEYGESRRFQSPLKATLSAAYVPSKNFALNVDYTLGLSKPEFGKMDAGAQSEMDDFFSNQYKNHSEVKIGGEYRIEGLRLRAGYGYASSPVDAMSLELLNTQGQNETASVKDLYAGSKQTLGAGIGYDFKSFYIDAAYNHISSNYHMPFLRGSEAQQTQYFSQSAYFANDSALVSDVDSKRSLISLTMGWKF